jgi:glycosyltransferase involved in cell wall biosynthesis
MELMRDIVRFDFGSKKRIFVLSFPYPPACKFLNELNAHGWATLYDVRDDWEEFSKVGMANWYNQPAEIYATHNCDVVTAVSAPLARKMQTLSGRQDIHLSPNAYDTGFLKDGVVGEAGRKSDSTVIGYFGHLTDGWFDWGFLARLAEARPGWRIEIIGHGMPDKLQLPKNVQYLGFLGHADICRVARSWHCAIIPFKISKLSEAVDPIKIYEYLALGLPTVSLTMPQIARYPYTTLATNLEEFIAAVEQSVSTGTDPEVIRKWLARNTWETRVDEMLELCATERVEKVPLKELCGTGGQG